MAEFLIPGKITVFIGPMFSGKTEALIERVERSRYAGLKGQIFKPVIDDRGEGLGQVVSKKKNSMPATAIKDPEEVFNLLADAVGIVGFDETQFFPPSIIPVVRELSERGLRVVVAGLPTDFRDEPFGSMPQLAVMAHEILKMVAICTFQIDADSDPCGDDATQTQRLLNGKPADYNDSIVVVGGEERYQPRCRRHHIVPNRPRIYLGK